MVLMLSPACGRCVCGRSRRGSLRTVALAAAMTGVMVLARPLGFIPAGTIGLLCYAGGLLALRIINRDELRMLTGRGGGAEAVAVEAGV